MGWDGFDDYDEDYWDQDYIDYMNKTGIYEEHDYDEEAELEDDLIMSGFDPDDLDEMDEDERREALEDAGMDPDDYDDLFLGLGSSGRTSHISSSSSYSRSSTTGSSKKPYKFTTTDRPPIVSKATANYRGETKGGEWGFIEYFGLVSFIAILLLVSYVVIKLGGGVFGVLLVIGIGLYIIFH